MRRIASHQEPQVRITYDVETRVGIQKREIPFVVGIFADLSGDLPATARPALRHRTMATIDADNFDAVLKDAHARIDLSGVPNVLDPQAPALSGCIHVESLEDLSPAAVVRKIDVLWSWYSDRCRIHQLRARAECEAELSQALDRVLRAEGPFPAGLSKDLIATFDARVRSGLRDDAEGEDLAVAMMGRAITTIDGRMSDQLSLILHHPNFQRLEATWRGLHHLVHRRQASPLVRLAVLNVKPEELTDDFKNCEALEDSAAFRIVSKAQGGASGIGPCGLLIGAYEIGPDETSQRLVTGISQVAAAALAPFIAAARADMLGPAGLAELARGRSRPQMFDGSDFALWNQFRETEDARFVALTLPRVLLRLPYGEGGLPTEDFDFQERMFPEADHESPGRSGGLPVRERFLWGNAAFFMAERIASAFARFRWPAAAWAVEGAARIDALPQYSFDASPGIRVSVGPTEIALSDPSVEDLGRLGMVPLSQGQDRRAAVLRGDQSTHRPRRYADAEVEAVARVSAKLACLLVASRFAHYVEHILGAKPGAFANRAEAESVLNAWIEQYVHPDGCEAQSSTAAHPLRGAKVYVTDVPGEAGSYRASLWLQPHFQLEDIEAALGLVVRAARSG